MTSDKALFVHIYTHTYLHTYFQHVAINHVQTQSRCPVLLCLGGAFLGADPQQAQQSMPDG